MYLIWSNEHKAWWGHGHSGYTNRIENAGHYSEKEALEICNGANYSWDEDTLPNELPIPAGIAKQLKFKAARDGTA